MNKRRTIVHIINSLSIGGAELLLLHTLTLLRDYDHVVCYLNGPDDLTPEFANWKTICLNHSTKLNVVRSVLKLRKIIKDSDASILHAHLLESIWISRLACPKDVKFVFSLHSILSQDAFAMNKFSLWMEKMTVRSRHNLLAVSQTVLDDYLSVVSFRGKSWVLHNFVPDVFFDGNKSHYYFEGKTDHLKLVAVGNLKTVKNYAYLLEAFKELQGLPVSLDIYGEGPERWSLQDTIDKYALPVKLKGLAYSIDKVLPKYDLYITSSLHEGYGIAPLEGLMSGIPVLSSNITVFKEVLGVHAFYFELNDSASFVALIQKFLLREIDIPKHNMAGKEWAKTIASVKTYKTRLNSIYQQILTNS